MQTPRQPHEQPAKPIRVALPGLLPNSTKTPALLLTSGEHSVHLTLNPRSGWPEAQPTVHGAARVAPAVQTREDSSRTSPRGCVCDQAAAGCARTERGRRGRCAPGPGCSVRGVTVLWASGGRRGGGDRRPVPPQCRGSRHAHRTKVVTSAHADTSAEVRDATLLKVPPLRSLYFPHNCWWVDDDLKVKI